MSFLCKFLALWGLVLVLAVTPVHAQIRSAAIAGTVLDSSGAPVPEAEVVVTEQNTNARYESRTNASGVFLVPYLPFGTYSVSVRRTGFQTITRSDLALSTAQTLRVDLTLQPGQVETSVTVRADAVSLQTEKASVENTVPRQVIEAIPNINNNPLMYATLQQGVVPRAAQVRTMAPNAFGIGTDGRRFFSAFSMNGGQAFSNDIQLDGVSVQASAWNEVAVVPNSEGIQEVKTNINNFSAEYGRAQGVVVISTKSGTNDFHGSALYRLRNEALNGNTWENNARGIARQPFKVNQFGGTFGGPVLVPNLYNGKDKTFFFFSYEGLRHNRAVDFLRTVPTELERNGNFSQTRVLDANGNLAPVAIFDPYNVVAVGENRFQRVAFPNAIIPVQRQHPAMAAWIKEYPLPNRPPDDPRGFNNFFNRDTRTFTRDNVNMRFDHRQGNAHSFYGTYGINRGLITTPYGWGAGNRNFTQSGFLGRFNGDDNFYSSIGDTWVISPTLVFDIRQGLTRVRARNEVERFDDIDYSRYGVPATFAPANAFPGAIPEVSGMGPWSQLNQPAYLAKNERQTNWHTVGSLTKVWGRLTIKAGGEYRTYLSNFIDARGSFWLDMSGALTSGNIIAADGSNQVAPTPEIAGYGPAAWFLGAGRLRAGENGVRLALAAKYAATFVQTDWRATNRLTLNLGLRWDVQPGPTERYNRMSSFVRDARNPFGTAGALHFPGVNGADRNLWQTQWRDFGPRLGLAYRLRDDVVIRAGYGMTYLPMNTGYFGGPFVYGAQGYFPTTFSDPFGLTPRGAIIGDFAQSTVLIPALGNDANDPRQYGVAGQRMEYDNYLNSRFQQWNFFVEKRFGGNWIASAGYTGTRGQRLPYGRFPLNNLGTLPDAVHAEWRAGYIASNGTDPSLQQVRNPWQPASGALLPFQGNIGRATISRRELALPYPHFLPQELQVSQGFSNYHALMLQVNRQFSNGLLLNAHYTWSKALEWTQSEAHTNGFGDTIGYIIGDNDFRNWRNNLRYSAQDTPHRVVVTGVYQLPFGQGRRFGLGGGVANAILGGWQIGSVFTANSGFPLLLGGNNTQNNTNGRAMINPGVPLVLPAELQGWYDGNRTITLPSGRTFRPGAFRYLRYNPDAFRGQTVRVANGQERLDLFWWGDAAPNYGVLRSDGRWNINLSLQKSFTLKERVQMQFSAEATNLANNVQWEPGQWTMSGGGLNPSGPLVGLGTNQNFGTRGAATFDPRQVEFRLRLVF